VLDMEPIMLQHILHTLGPCTDEGLQQIFHRIVTHGLPSCEWERISLDGAGHGLGALIKLAGTILQKVGEEEWKVREKSRNYYNQDPPTIKSL
jgi:hypothetical protein